MFIGRFALGFAAKRAGPTATRSKDLPGRWCFGVLAPSVRRLLGEHGRRAALNRGDLDWVARRRSPHPRVELVGGPTSRILCPDRMTLASVIRLVNDS